MGKQRWATGVQSAALILVITPSLLMVSRALPPTTVQAAGTTSPTISSCSRQPLAANLWNEPVSGTEMVVTLYGYYEHGHFCGALEASAALTLPAGSEAEWICLTVHTDGQDACGAGYDARWTCLTLQSLGTGACGELGPGPATGQQLFVIASPAHLQPCTGVDAHMRGFLTAAVSITSICG